MSPFVHLTDIYIVIEFGAIIRNEYNLNNQAIRIRSLMSILFSPLE